MSGNMKRTENILDNHHYQANFKQILEISKFLTVLNLLKYINRRIIKS